jgi:hypothetical protein
MLCGSSLAPQWSKGQLISSMATIAPLPWPVAATVRLTGRSSEAAETDEAWFG